MTIDNHSPSSATTVLAGTSAARFRELEQQSDTYGFPWPSHGGALRIDSPKSDDTS